MELIPAFNFNIVKKYKENKTPEPIVLKAIRELTKKRKFKIVEYENVIDPFELYAECASQLEKNNKKKGNTNAKNK